MANLQTLITRELARNLTASDSPRIPAGGALLWRWFLDLNQSRTYHQAGPNPISFVEIESYGRLHQLPIEKRHVAILQAMDRTYLDHVYAGRKAAAAASGVKTLQPISKRPISAGLVDAIFG